MTTRKTLRNGLLAATSVAALTFAAVTAQADTIGFAPGVSSANAGNVHSAGVDLNTKNVVDDFKWSSVNRGMSNDGAISAGFSVKATAAGLGGVEAQQSWFLNINSADNTASTNDTFDEFFSFSLISTTDQGAAAIDAYGQVSGGAHNFASHVFMEFTGSGTIKDIVGDANYDSNVRFGLNYNSASFVMVFDPDGDLSTDAGKTTIATFLGDGTTLNPFTLDANSGEMAAKLSFKADWLTAFEGVFDLPIGNDVSEDGDATAGELNPLNLLAFQIADQEVFRTFSGSDRDAEAGDAEAGFDISYFLTSDDLSTGSSELQAVVPEPGTLALFGVGLIGLGFAARRRRKVA